MASFRFVFFPLSNSWPIEEEVFSYVYLTVSLILRFLNNSMAEKLFKVCLALWVAL